MHLGEVAAGKESFIPLEKSSKKTDSILGIGVLAAL